MSLGMSHLLPTTLLWPTGLSYADEGEEERYGRARRRMIVLAILAYAAWFVYTRNAKHSAPVWGHRYAKPQSREKWAVLFFISLAFSVCLELPPLTSSLVCSAQVGRPDRGCCLPVNRTGVRSDVCCKIRGRSWAAGGAPRARCGGRTARRLPACDARFRRLQIPQGLRLWRAWADGAQRTLRGRISLLSCACDPRAAVAHGRARREPLDPQAATRVQPLGRHPAWRHLGDGYE